MKKLDSKRIIAFLLSLYIWFFAIIPFFANLSDSKGVIFSFSIFLILSYIYFRIIFGQTGLNPKHIALFLWSYIVIDIIQPPKLISLQSPTDSILLTGEQSFSSEIYFYKIFTALGIPHNIAWYLTYFGIPLFALALLMYYYTGKRLDKIVLGAMR